MSLVKVERHIAGTMVEFYQIMLMMFLQIIWKLKKRFYETKLVVTREEINRIQEQMKGQADSNIRIFERRKRLTASTVGSIAKMRSTP